MYLRTYEPTRAADGELCLENESAATLFVHDNDPGDIIAWIKLYSSSRAVVGRAWCKTSPKSNKRRRVPPPTPILFLSLVLLLAERWCVSVCPKRQPTSQFPHCCQWVVFDESGDGQSGGGGNYKETDLSLPITMPPQSLNHQSTATPPPIGFVNQHQHVMTWDPAAMCKVWNPQGIDLSI